MKFNMGCGKRKFPDFVNVDSSDYCQPDQVHDLDQTPWPWDDNCAETVYFIHSLEHMGGDPKVFMAIMKELYRICAPGAQVVIHAPHPWHDNFIGDPTHVRIINPQVLQLFDKDLNDQWATVGASNTPLAHILGVDFAITRTEVVIDEPYLSRMNAGEISHAEIGALVRNQPNVASEYRLTLTARK